MAKSKNTWIWIILIVIGLMYFTNSGLFKKQGLPNGAECTLAENVKGTFDDSQPNYNCASEWCEDTTDWIEFWDDKGICADKPGDTGDICDLPIGAECDLGYDVPIVDDSKPDMYCSTGWCEDDDSLGFPIYGSGKCNSAPFGKTPHQYCQSGGFCFDTFNRYLGRYFDNNCQTSTIVGLAVIFILIMFMMAMMRK